MHGAARSALFFSLASLASCNDAERETLRDRGTACVEVSPFDVCSEAELAANAPLSVVVDFDTCLSGNCDSVVREGCRATRSGSVVTIAAEAVVEREEGGVCTLDCITVSASCEIPPLPAGSYELRYGAASMPFTLPSTTAVLCAGSREMGRCCDTSDDCDGAPCESSSCR